MVSHLYGQLKKLFLEQLNLDIPAVDTDLFEEAFLDSLQFVQLLSLLEQNFQIHISIGDIEIENFKSIKNIAGFIGERMIYEAGR
jgi:acyl carrier protein